MGGRHKYTHYYQVLSISRDYTPLSSSAFYRHVRLQLLTCNYVLLLSGILVWLVSLAENYIVCVLCCCAAVTLFAAVLTVLAYALATYNMPVTVKYYVYGELLVVLRQSTPSGVVCFAILASSFQNFAQQHPTICGTAVIGTAIVTTGHHEAAHGSCTCTHMRPVIRACAP